MTEVDGELMEELISAESKYNFNVICGK
jgi:hypothetical protein